MEPINYIELINDYYQSKGYPPYRWSMNERVPLAPLRKPLTECTVSMLTSGGISYRSAAPFNPIAKDDFRLDAIDPASAHDAFQIHDAYYDHRHAERDINVVFPLARLRELARDGVIGRVADRLWSGFMGRIYKRQHIIDEAGPRFAEELHRDGVDAIVLVPAWPLDHQTVGLVSRVVEEHGIATVNVSTGRDLTAQVKPPRAVFVNHPMGNPFGRPGDAATQTAILRAALDRLEACAEPGELIDLPHDWGERVLTIFDLKDAFRAGDPDPVTGKQPH